MQIIKLIQAILTLVLLCIPVWLHSGTVSIDVIHLSALAGSACQVRQPDLSVGTVVFVKGQIAINGVESVAGTPLRSGDEVTTGTEGFVIVALGDGKRVSVQPLSHLSINCTTKATSADVAVGYEVDQPHRLGAIRG